MSNFISLTNATTGDEIVVNFDMVLGFYKPKEGTHTAVGFIGTDQLNVKESVDDILMYLS